MHGGDAPAAAAVGLYEHSEARGVGAGRLAGLHLNAQRLFVRINL